MVTPCIAQALAAAARAMTTAPKQCMEKRSPVAAFTCSLLTCLAKLVGCLLCFSVGALSFVSAVRVRPTPQDCAEPFRKMTTATKHSGVFSFDCSAPPSRRSQFVSVLGRGQVGMTIDNIHYPWYDWPRIFLRCCPPDLLAKY